MIKPSPYLAAGALALFAATALAQSGAQSTGPVDVRATMQQQVNTAMLAIWDISNNAMTESGGIDPAQMDEARWTQVAEAADRLAAAGHSMAGSGSFLAAAPDNMTVGEGEITMVDVQKHLDGDPDGLRQMAAAMAGHAEKIAAAARARDAAATGELIAETDAVCESCHARYWYPE